VNSHYSLPTHSTISCAFSPVLSHRVAYFESAIVPYQQSKGCRIHASFRSIEDETVFFWMRSFDSPEQKEEQYKMMYGKDWEDGGFAAQVKEHIDLGDNFSNLLVTRVKELPCSLPLPSFVPGKARGTDELVTEIRSYKVKAGKMEAWYSSGFSSSSA
jgi:hypothetical protein